MGYDLSYNLNKRSNKLNGMIKDNKKYFIKF